MVVVVSDTRMLGYRIDLLHSEGFNSVHSSIVFLRGKKGKVDEEERAAVLCLILLDTDPISASRLSTGGDASTGPVGPDESSVGLDYPLGPAGYPSRHVAVLGRVRCHDGTLFSSRHGSGSLALLARHGADNFVEPPRAV